MSEERWDRVRRFVRRHLQTLEQLLAWALDRGEPAAAPLAFEAGTLALTAADGRALRTGIFARAARQAAGAGGRADRGR